MTKGTILKLILISAIIYSCQSSDDEPKESSNALTFIVEKIDLEHSASLRGLSVISDSTWWISGSQGTAAYLDYSNGNLKSNFLTGYDSKDFRDIHGWNNNEATTLSVGDSAVILKTTNRWRNAQKVFEDNNDGVFIDAMDFEGDHGVAFGDSHNGSLYILESRNRGISWKRIESNKLPKPVLNEGGFAASGTNVDIIEGVIYIGTGAGEHPRLLRRRTNTNWEARSIPLQRGPLNGAYSIVFKNKLEGITVGGSFRDSTRIDSVIAYTKDGGDVWTIPEQGPNGFRSCVAYSPILDIYVVTGRTGVDYSHDGLQWHSITTESGYYACQFGHQSAILVGRGGKCARIKFIRN